MPRYKEPYTIFPRKLNSGKVVYYYRTYSPDGRRSVAHSTGKANKTQARCYCAELLAKGQLYSPQGINFSAYAKGFFDNNSQWYKDKIQTGKDKTQPVALNTLRVYRNALDRYILPFFQKIKLADIRVSHIKKFRSELIEKGFSNSTITTATACLKIIISYAIADGYIIKNPFTSIQNMYENARKKNAFSEEELKIVFHNKWKSENRRLFSLIGATTGMRVSEILAIRKETLFDTYIEVKDQLYCDGYSPVKDGEKRKVRICSQLFNLLSNAIESNNGIAFPESKVTYTSHFYKATEMTLKERQEKGLTFHSLRHFFNTYLLTNGITEIKTKSILGHSSGKGSMTERYANFLPEHFDDVAALQDKLLDLFL